MNQIANATNGEVEVILEPTWAEDFTAARQYEEMAKLSANQAVAFMILAGFELTRLHKQHAIHRGGDQSRKRAALLWSDLVKEHMGISKDTAERRMSLAAECQKRLPKLNDLHLLLETPLKDLPELKRIQITDAVRGITDGASAHQLMLDWGIARPSSGHQKYTPPKKLTPAQQFEQDEELARLSLQDLLQHLHMFKTTDPRAHLSKSEREELLGACIDFNHWLRESLTTKPANQLN